MLSRGCDYLLLPTNADTNFFALLDKNSFKLFDSYVIKNILMKLKHMPNNLRGGTDSLNQKSPINVTINTLLKSHTMFIIVNDSAAMVFRNMNGFIVYKAMGSIIHHALHPKCTFLIVVRATESMTPNRSPNNNVAHLNIFDYCREIL
jgi:hypothetical protein